MPENYQRELFIGLGGTGGNALKLLYRKMTNEQKAHAKYVFIDTDQGDIAQLRTDGIRSIAISNADNVRQVAESLGENDGVRDWLPNGKTEGQFLSSWLYDGASQCRFKSRLCLARFFKEGAHGLRELLEEMTPPGIQTENVALRIVIVSSIAGGTGAGTFIQMALYIRKFFRKLRQEANIIGILACPDLFTGVANNEIERESMYANAYAAIRELNAMNLATSNTDPVKKDKDPEGKLPEGMVRGYGSKITVKLCTASEGTLFDSKDPSFKNNVKAKPFDQIYFVDKANEKGGIMQDLNAYYQVMADVAYIRLYSPMNDHITDGENNEMHAHTAVPTAIYGGAGYAKIIYPYRDILKYLAERRLHEELSAEWMQIDDQWKSYCEREQDIAVANNARWLPAEGAQGVKYREALDKEFAKENSRFSYLKDMVLDTGISRAVRFCKEIEAAAASLPGKGADNMPDDIEELKKLKGECSVLGDYKVQAVLKDLLAITSPVEETKDAKGIYAELQSKVAEVENRWSEFIAALEDAVKHSAQDLASKVIPMTDIAVKTHDKGKLSLHYGLLCKNGNDVHPLAARYLLYGLQDQCLSRGSSNSKLEEAQKPLLENIKLALDTDRDDDYDRTVEAATNETMGHLIWSPGHKKEQALGDYEDFCRALLSNLAQSLKNADKAVVARTFHELTEPVNELVSMYESFFASIKDYKETLSQKVNMDLHRHDTGGTQTIYVGASSDVKEHYAVDNTVIAALSADPNAVYAATGEGIYAKISERMRERIQEKKEAARLGEGVEAPRPKPWDMNVLFQSILKKYEQLLDEKASTLKTNAIGALINEVCTELDIKISEIGDEDHPGNRSQFETAFRKRITDLRAKARPMIRYDAHNTKNYYLEEVTNPILNVSKTYCNFGFSLSARETIKEFFDTKAEDPFAGFRAAMQFDDEAKVLADGAYEDNEIFCFSAVHCLQPTQIYHFLEDQGEDSYYPSYKARMNSGIISDCPHLDKRWGSHGAMPYISANLEQEWRKKVMKALIYEALVGRIICSVGQRGEKYFMRTENSIPTCVCWPKGQPVLAFDISRLVEYLAEDEERVQQYVKQFDKKVEKHIREIYNYARTPALFKQGMTKDRLLSNLRKDMLTFDPSVAAAEKLVEGEDGEAAVDINRTLGGVLRIAYHLHESETRLGEDKDYGETLLDVAKEVVDKFALGMYGEAQMDGSSTQHKEYIEIYNWAIKKFIEDWARFAAVEKNIKCTSAKDGAQPKTARNSRLSEESEVVLPSDIEDVPAQLLRDPEYTWIAENWKTKELYKYEED